MVTRIFSSVSSYFVVAICSCALITCGVLANDSWTLMRGNSLGTGVAETKLPKHLELLWKFEVESGAFDATPAILNGIAYIGDLDGTFYAFDLASGKPKWTYKVEDTGFPCSVAVKDGLAYVGDYYGILHCFDLKTKQPKWKFESGAQINGSPTFYKENLLVGSQDATLYCLNAKTGAKIWEVQIEDQIQCSPTVVDGRCFLAGCDGKLHIIDVEKGEQTSAVEINDPTIVTPAVLNDKVYFGTEGGVLFCVDWKQSKTEWVFEDPRSYKSIRSSPAVTNSVVIFGSRSRQVYAVNPTTGRLIWKQPVRRNVDASIVISGDRAFVGVTDGRLLAMNVKDGNTEWQFQGRGGFTGSPAIAENKLVIASDEGVVYCFGEKDK